jgi:hypothetical protein
MPGFMQTQYRFAGAIRDPENAAAPEDVDPRRMAVYQELIYNNIEDFLSNAFPVLRNISGDDHWHALVRDFIVEHRATTPLFPEMPREFLAYLENERVLRDHDFPFMLELAHYEWVELAVSISEEHIDEQGIARDGSLLDGSPVLSPVIWLCNYRYPVHRIGPAFIPEKPDDTPTFLLVYRNRDDEVGFMELNPVSAELIQRLQQDSTQTGKQLLKTMAEAMQHPNPATVIDGGLHIMQMLQEHDIILGTRAAGAKP